MRTAQWITMALLAPVWWGTGLMILALLADLSPWWRVRVLAVFDRSIEHGLPHLEHKESSS